MVGLDTAAAPAEVVGTENFEANMGVGMIHGGSRNEYARLLWPRLLGSRFPLLSYEGCAAVVVLDVQIDASR